MTCQSDRGTPKLPTCKTVEVGSGPGKRVYSAELDETGEVEVVMTCEGMVQALVFPVADVTTLRDLLSGLE